MLPTDPVVPQEQAAPMTPTSDRMPPMPAELDKQVANLIKHLLDAARAARKPFLETRDEVAKYAYDKTFDFIYQKTHEELFFKAKIAKAAEFVEIMGAALYPANPEASVNTYEFATATQAQRHKTEKLYCDFSWRHGQMADHGSRMVHDALLGGRGVLWTGYNARKNVVQSVHDTVDNLLIDPDAKNREEINWVARRRVKPRWMLAKLYPEAKEKVQRLEKFSDTKSQRKNGSAEPASDLVEYHEVYTRVALGNYAPSMNTGDSEVEKIFSDDAPRKFIVADGCVLSIEDWEIPFFMGDMWPCEWYDPLMGNGGIWATSPLETGLGHLRALNWIYTLYLSKMRVTTRTPLIVASYNGQGLTDDAVVKILKGADLDIVRIAINGETIKLGDLVQQFKFDTGVEEFERFVNIVGSAFEKASGLYEVLYTGTTQTQIRNATTADMIRNASTSRVNTMQSRMEQFMGRIAMKTMLAARYLESPQDIATKFGPGPAASWGELAPPEMVQHEQQMRQQTKQMIVQQMMHPPMPMPMPDPATAEQDAEDQLGPEQLVSMESWLNEASRDIAAGSMRPMNPQAQIDNLNVALNQLAPSVATLPGGAALVANIAVEFARLNKYSQEFQQATQRFAAQATQVSDAQVAMASAPPPPPMPPQGPGPKAGPDGGTPTI